MTVLVVGARGFVGSAYVEHLRDAGREVLGTSRSSGADVVVSDRGSLDAALAHGAPTQVVVTAQLTADDLDWLLDRVDGARWIVLSSSQVGAEVAAPESEVARRREDDAIARGAVVLRPTMIFGRGRDQNVTRLIRQLRRGFAVVPGDGSQLVQPLHVDDLCELLASLTSASPAGRYALGGAEAVPLAELVEMLQQIQGGRAVVARAPSAAVDLAARGAGIVGLRPDQIRRLLEHKDVDDAEAREVLGWDPAPLPHRLEQAVDEVGADG